MTLVVLAALALALERRGASRFDELVAAVEDGEEPVAALVAAGRANRFLFITDVAGSASPDRLAGDVLTRLSRSVGVDVVVVAVSEDEQSVIDRYLRSDPEDAGLLLTNVRAVGGAGTPLLELLRTIWRLNREVGAARSIRVIAADLPGWPPARALAPAQAVTRFAGRDAHMMDVLNARVLVAGARPRVVFLMDGLHGLRVPYALRTGGAAVEVTPLAARLAAMEPREVWSVLVDAPAGAATPEVALFAGSPAREALRRAGLAGRGFALTTAGRPFGAAEDWVSVVSLPGVSFAFEERDVALDAVVNQFLYLPQ